jgi:2-amino-4-hydroxy-6-hydroxymethyldihydropteridine diphosphokinase
MPLREKFRPRRLPGRTEESGSAVATAYIALGSNLGDRLAALQRAVDALDAYGTVVAVSSLYDTVPVGYVDQPTFLNAAVQFETALSPAALLAALHQIEADNGRVRTFLNAPRTLDLDLLLYDDIIINGPTLIVPHPRLHERAFVLAPLSEIARDARHPVLNRTITDLWGGLQDQDADLGIRRLPERLVVSHVEAKGQD